MTTIEVPIYLFLALIGVIIFWIGYEVGKAETRKRMKNKEQE